MPEYTVVLRPDIEEGGYVATVPALGGIATQGETRDEAIEMARDMIAGYLAVLVSDGEEIPSDTVPSECVRVAVDVGITPETDAHSTGAGGERVGR